MLYSGPRFFFRALLAVIRFALSSLQSRHRSREFRQLLCSNIDKCSVTVLGACVSGPSVCSFVSMYGIYFDLLFDLLFIDLDRFRRAWYHWVR